jgi:hypothetical protein
MDDKATIRPGGKLASAVTVLHSDAFQRLTMTPPHPDLAPGGLRSFPCATFRPPLAESSMDGTSACSGSGSSRVRRYDGGLDLPSGRFLRPLAEGSIRIGQ